MGANKVLDRKYFARPATELAADLLGKWLCVRRDGEILKRRITETECYYGELCTRRLPTSTVSMQRSVRLSTEWTLLMPSP